MIKWNQKNNIKWTQKDNCWECSGIRVYFYPATVDGPLFSVVFGKLEKKGPFCTFGFWHEVIDFLSNF